MLASIIACLVVGMCVIFVMKCVDMFLEAPTEVKYAVVILLLMLIFYTSYRTRYQCILIKTSRNIYITHNDNLVHIGMEQKNCLKES
jgi:undecaprenyl pyrophosphate phosphatase UppP